MRAIITRGFIWGAGGWGGSQLGQEMGGRKNVTKANPRSGAVDKDDSKAVDEALEGKPEESHG